MSKEKKVSIGFRASPELKDNINAIVEKQEGVTVSSFVSDVLEGYFAANEEPRDNDKIESLETELQQHRAWVTEKNEKIAKLEGEITSLKTSLGLLRGTVQQKVSEILKLQEQVDNTVLTKIKEGKPVLELEQQARELSEEVKELSEANASLSEKLLSAESDLQEQIDANMDLEEKLKQSDANVLKLGKEKARIIETKNEWTESNKRLLRSVVDLTTDKENLELTIERMSKEIEKLNTQRKGFWVRLFNRD